MALDDLPKSIQDLQNPVRDAIRGTVLGREESPGGAVEARAAIVALRQCYEYAPGAHVDVIQEAAIRLAGWLIGTRPHARSQTAKDPSGEELSLDFLNSHATANGFRSSGASQLLARYRRLRGGVF